MEKNKIFEIVFTAAVSLSKRLIKTSCLSVNCCYILEVFNTYCLWKVYSNPPVTMDQENKNKQ